MDYLVSQLALYLAVMGVLGLLLGWWLGRSGTRRGAKETEAELEARLAMVEQEHEQASREVGRLADQLAEARIELEEAHESSSTAISNLSTVEEDLAVERQRVASFEPLLAKRDNKLEMLRGELAAFHDRLTTLEDDKRQARNQVESLAAELSAARARAEELASAAAVAQQQAEHLRARSEENAAQGAEIARLKQTEQDLRQALERAADRDEETQESRRQLEEAGLERDRVVAELATLSRRLEEAELERKSHDLAAEAARRELEAQRQQVEYRDRRIAAFESLSIDSSELQLEVDSLRGELSASARRVEDLQRRVGSTEAAREAAEGERDKVARELETLISAPLIDVDRMATAKPVAFETGETDYSGLSASPELLEVPRGAADDLRQIRGIGEVLAGTLNALGIYHFGQIAEWSESDIQWVAAHIDTFPDRILRDEWREQARDLELEKERRRA